LATWLNDFYNTLDGLSDEIKTEAMNIFTQISFRDLDSIMSARTKLEGLNVGEATLAYFDKFTLELKDLGIAMANIDLEAVIK
jgi:hypothetical protein